MNITLSIIYLIATITFVIGLKLLGHPETAKRGNLIAASGMGLAIIGTIFLHNLEVSNLVYALIGIAILVGAIIGWVISVKVPMTKMPELVSLFNGLIASIPGLAPVWNVAAILAPEFRLCNPVPPLFFPPKGSLWLGHIDIDAVHPDRLIDPDTGATVGTHVVNDAGMVDFDPDFRAVTLDPYEDTRTCVQ